MALEGSKVVIVGGSSGIGLGVFRPFSRYPRRTSSGSTDRINRPPYRARIHRCDVGSAFSLAKHARGKLHPDGSITFTSSLACRTTANLGVRS
jgi:hypothetical protein